MLAQRFFRAEAATYEAMRLGLDAAWGFPNAGTRSCYRPASEPYVPQDAAGRLYLAVHAEWCEWDDVAAVLPGLLASGAVEEVGRDAYMAALPVGP
ncbi:MAG: hypothetical protein VKK63_08400 [Synechococcus sp.]|nr:hypothetical protein [Synechococcus sp.]